MHRWGLKSALLSPLLHFSICITLLHLHNITHHLIRFIKQSLRVSTFPIPYLALVPRKRDQRYDKRNPCMNTYLGIYFSSSARFTLYNTIIHLSLFDVCTYVSWHANYCTLTLTTCINYVYREEIRQSGGFRESNLPLEIWPGHVLQLFSRSELSPRIYSKNFKITNKQQHFRQTTQQK